MSESSADLATALRLLREARGWSQEELAQAAGMPVEQIAAYEADSVALDPRIVRVVAETFPLRKDGPAGSVSPPDEPSPLVMAQMEARMRQVEVALAIDMRDFSRALEKIESTLTLCPGEEMVGILLISKAEVYAELGYDGAALEVLVEAQRHLDAEAEPELWLRTRLEQLHLLCQLARWDEAAALEAETLDLAIRVGRDRRRMEARHLAGRIAAGSGRAQAALPLLQEARENQLATDRTGEAAATALDLAAVLIELGDAAALAQLAREVETLGRRKKLPVSVSARLKLFIWSVRGKRLDAERSRTLAQEIRHAAGRLRRPYEIPVMQAIHLPIG